MNILVKVALSSLVVLGLTTTGLSAKTYKLKMAMSWKKTTPILAATALRAAELADEMSDGRLKIRVDGAEKHKAPFGIFDFVKQGLYDIGHTASYYYKGKDFKMVFFTTVPFGMTPNEQYSWYYEGGGKELAQKVYEKHGLLTFMGGNTGIQMGGWFKKEIKHLDDLKGLKFRIPGLGGEVMAKLGVNAVNIAPGELYMSLELGTIDAVEWVSPYFDTKLGLHKIAPFYYTAWQEPASELQFIINEKKFKKLPNDLQVILKSAFKVATFEMMQKANYQNALTWSKIKQDYPNIKVKTFSKEIIDALKVASKEIFDEQARKDPLFKEILESQRKYQKKAEAWTDISDKVYLQTR
ncbi:MAG: TRAP-type mannitol/chloroaromatic compound transport system substrate-binding protein [Sulfurimonas sp.]